MGKGITGGKRGEKSRKEGRKKKKGNSNGEHEKSVRTVR